MTPASQEATMRCSLWHILSFCRSKHNLKMPPWQKALETYLSEKDTYNKNLSFIYFAGKI
ncbi:hypothetical protein DRJ04_07260 [Candidatus Aerophobetes bacterium]|uniref:Uncharacterized protein n=1 Tax=Aerophobetes bacterium TaxID=2030807 RepID=A0A662D8S3_UNCAE|nr:MAG: hypothetical protein DRJ04_07260 [Candidatus Aerophobetes bacterium]